MRKLIYLFVLLIFCLTSCSQEQYTKYDFFAMNTFVSVISCDEDLAKVCEKTISDAENKLSRTLDNSEISGLNNNEQPHLSEDTVQLIEESLEMAKKTDYAFSPCLGALTELWNITSGENYVPDEREIKKALEFCNVDDVIIESTKVSLKNGTKIDLGGVAKGYALQQAAEQMKKAANQQNKSTDFCISLGGNVAVSGSSKSMKKQKTTGWNVGITNPFDKSTILGSIVIEEGYVSVSGAYERYFEKDGQIYHHIFDSKTGSPAVTDLASTVVYSENGLEADALSTALFVMGKDAAINFHKEKLYDFEMMLVTNEGEIFLSRGFYEKFKADEYVKDLNGNLFVNNIWVV